MKETEDFWWTLRDFATAQPKRSQIKWAHFLQKVKRHLSKFLPSRKFLFSIFWPPSEVTRTTCNADYVGPPLSLGTWKCRWDHLRPRACLTQKETNGRSHTVNWKIFFQANASHCHEMVAEPFAASWKMDGQLTSKSKHPMNQITHQVDGMWPGGSGQCACFKEKTNPCFTTYTVLAAAAFMSGLWLKIYYLTSSHGTPHW